MSMGNPHNLIYAKDGAPIDVASLPLESIGSDFENLAIFPARTNTEFVEVRASLTLCSTINLKGQKIEGQPST